MPPEQDELLPSGYTKIQEIIGQWSERDGCWFDESDTELRDRGYSHNKEIDGSEARVFFDEKTGHVWKTVDFSHYPSLSAFLDRITIHNALFPETRLEVKGFGLRDDAIDNRGYIAVVRQPFVRGEAPDSPEAMQRVADELAKRGIRMSDKYSGWFFVSESGNLLIADVHDNNCVFSPQGNLLVFDCEAILNTNPNLGGKWEIPPLDFDETSVKEILDVLRSLVPMNIAKEVITDDSLYPSKERERALKELKTFGRTLTPVTTIQGEREIWQLDPEDPENVLVSWPGQIARMLQNHNGDTDDGIVLTREELDRIAAGSIVKKGSTAFHFDLDKGRIDNLRKGLRLYLHPQLMEIHAEKSKPTMRL